MKKNLISNLFYQYIYTILNILFPLILSPYVSRVIGATNLGKVNFVNDIINVFLIFSTFGITTYGTRECAKIKDNKKKLDKLFSELLIINTILSVITFIFYLIIIIFIPKFSSDFYLFLIMSISILLNILSIDWYYKGIEEFKYITQRNLLAKIISLILIFVFVKNSSDYFIYGIISILITSLNSISNFIHSRKFVNISLNNINLKKHFKPLFVFFLQSLFVNIYTNFDRIILGFYKDTNEIAYVHKCNTIYSILFSLISVLVNVTFVRLNYIITQNKNINSHINKIYNVIIFILLPLTFGLYTLSYNAMYILGGNDFTVATNCLKIYAFILLFSSLNTWLKNHIYLTLNKEKTILNLLIITSILSLILNLIFIPKFDYTILALIRLIMELLTFIILYFTAIKKLNIKITLINKNTIKYLFASIIMFIIIYNLNHIMYNPIISAIICIVSGAIIYFITLLILKDEILETLIKIIKKKGLKHERKS